MDLKLIRYDYFLVVFLLTCYPGHGLYEEDYDDAPSFGRCPWIRNKLKNGRVKLRSRGRIAKFLCDPGYELAGKRFATCVRGQWNNPIPVCVARGCSRKPAIRNGRITEMHRGAMLVYDCNPGYTLDGSVSIHCDGRRWSSDPPACVITTSEPETKCDFEDPDLCGWSHDPTHDFDWKRNQFSTPSGHVGTGPSYDHTFGVGKGGFYLYLEASSPRKVNDTSRLFSPVYPQDLSGGCFIFWYHMYGATTGGLRVYLKPESHVFGELSPTWEKFGDQGNQWLRGHIPIPRLNENFQIVIEGIRGASYVGDSAIDDVQLTKSDCESMENATDTVADTVAESCRGRCREPDEESSCGCNENCVLNDTCCADYATICTSGNDTSGENPDESLPVEELGKTPSLVTMTITKSAVAENTEAETTSTTKKITTITTQEITKATTTTISSSTSSTVPSTTLASSSTSTAASTKLSTTLSELIYNTTIPSTSTSTTKSSTTQMTSSSTKQTPQTTITNSSAKPVSENNTTVMTSSTSDILSTEAPTSSTSALMSTTAATASSTTSSTTPVMETTSVANTSPKVEVPIAISTSSVKIEDISPSTSSTSSSTSSSSSSAPSTSITSTPSTRKTYNLRPRTQKTTPTTQQYSSSVSSTSIPVTTTSSTVVQTTLSTSVTPLSIIEKLTSVTSRKDVETITQPSVTLRSSSTVTSTSSTPPSSTSTTRITSTTSRTSTTFTKMSTKIRYMIPTTNLVTVRIPRTTETVYQILTTPSSVSNHASKAASTSNNGSQPTITIVSISVVAILCLAGGLAYYMKKQKAKRQSKLSDDSEMRFLPENEFMESSEGSAADILGKW